MEKITLRFFVQQEVNERRHQGAQRRHHDEILAFCAACIRHVQPGGVPDECELDTDGDRVIDDCDNCLQHSNPEQVDCNNNEIGDVCDLAAVADGGVEHLLGELAAVCEGQ